MAATLALLAALTLSAGAHDPCSRAAPGSPIPEPQDLRSDHGVLKVDLSVHDFREPDGSTRYCYVLPDGGVAPTLRLHPGDLLVLHLKNELVDPDPAAQTQSSAPAQPSAPAHSHEQDRKSVV